MRFCQWVRGVALGLALVIGCENPKPEPTAPPKSNPAPHSTGQQAVRANLLLITFDTTRADRLGCYGFALARTPNVDRLAAEGVRCTDAISTAPITAVAHASILTGLNPPAHGVRDNGTYSLPDEVTTLAERLKSAGYATQAFVSAIVLDRRYNLSQGFDGYDDQLEEEDAPPLFMIRDRPAQRTAVRAAAWLRDWRERPERPPFFLWIHFFDPHQPYEPRVRNRHLMPTLYDAEIAAADEGLGIVHDAIREAGEWDRTLTVMTADHGESLGEHGEKTHAIFVYDATVKVPLIWRLPESLPAGMVYDGPVRCIDIFPTALRLMGVENDVSLQGVDLSAAFRGQAAPPDVPQYSESMLAELGFGMAPLFAIRHGGFKLIRVPRPELYDLRQDPKELTNILSQHRSRAVELNKQLDAVLSQSGPALGPGRLNPLDQETSAALQALGYLGTREDRESMGGIDPKDGIVQYTKLETARHLCQAKLWKPAELTLRDLLAEAPNNVSARNILALCLLRTDRAREAETEYRESLKVEPHQSRVLQMLGQMRLEANDLDEAEKHFKAALAMTPRFVESMILLAFIETRRGNDAAARAWYERALQEEPDSPRIHQQLGDLYFVRGDYAAARTNYEAALAASPRSFEALMQSAVCSKRLGEREKAIGLYKRAEELRPDSWKPPYNLACIAALAGDNETARGFLVLAAERGLTDGALAQRDPDLASVRTAPWFAEWRRTVESRP